MNGRLLRGEEPALHEEISGGRASPHNVIDIYFIPEEIL